MTPRYHFNRLELAGSLGDLGTLLPLGLGMILTNGLDPSGVFWSVGLMYIFTGLYYGVPTPVQPMKVIGAYAIATSMTSGQVQASVLLMAVVLLLLGATGIVGVLGRAIPRVVVRGIQLATGILLMKSGLTLVLGTAPLQRLYGAAEPFLALEHLIGMPIGWLIGAGAFTLTLFFLNSRRFPAGLIVIAAGLAIGFLAGRHTGWDDLRWGFHLPGLFPLGHPVKVDFTFALLALVLPQLPMTVGNAVIADADLAERYFGADAHKTTHRALCLSMGLANLACYLFGGMPLCHGAGGLAAHYRFGARTAGSNLIIGVLIVAAALFFGRHIVTLVHLLPFSVLGVLLLFAGSQLALSISDLQTRRDLFVIFVMLGLTLAANLGVGFVVGLGVALFFKHSRVSI